MSMRWRMPELLGTNVSGRTAPTDLTVGPGRTLIFGLVLTGTVSTSDMFDSESSLGEGGREAELVVSWLLGH